MIKLGQWHKDNMGDYVIEIEHPTAGITVRGRIVRCHQTRRFRERFWNTKNRWLLIVNDHTYGFWNTMSEAIHRFGKDCVPRTEATPLVDNDPHGMYYCWHGDTPYGKGKYCTGCGGLIKKNTIIATAVA